MTNQDVARMLNEIALHLDMDEVAFKPRAYERAAQAVAAVEEPLMELHERGGLKAIMALPGVGKSIAEKIEEFLTTGHVALLDEMREKVPVDMAALTEVEGVGARTVKSLYNDLGIRSLSDLAEAAKAGRIRELPHFGVKSEEKILRGLSFLEQAAGRIPIGRALRELRPVLAALRALSFVQRADLAGSTRRFKETVGDADFLAVSDEPDRVMEWFTTMPDVVGVHARGPTKSSVRLRMGLDGDLRVVPAESYGAALCYFTGSKAHNVALRRIAIQKGYKLNEYGLFGKANGKSVAGRTEEEVYDALGLPWIPPEMREDQGEIEAARDGTLPRVIEHGALRGDLQIQTTWTDGKNSLEEMAAEANRRGLQYIAITDHTRDLPMTRGSDEARLREQAAAIRALDQGLRGIRVLSGAEVNIRRDGSVDIADDALAELDVVGAGMHHHFDLPRDEQTRRLIRAVENPHVDILFHPTGRSIEKRPAADFDLDAVLAAAVRCGTVIEINAHPKRLDLKDEHIRRALAAGALLAIDSDAHSAAELAYPDEMGIPLARRGWVEADRVVNALPLKAFLAALKGGRHAAAKRG